MWLEGDSKQPPPLTVEAIPCSTPREGLPLTVLVPSAEGFSPRHNLEPVVSSPASACPLGCNRTPTFLGKEFPYNKSFWGNNKNHPFLANGVLGGNRRGFT